MGHIFSSIFNNLSPSLRSLLAFYLSFIHISSTSRSLCPFWVSFICATCRNCNNTSWFCSQCHCWYSHCFCRLSSTVHNYRTFTPTTISHKKFHFYYIFGRATYWWTLCTITISYSMIMFLLYKEKRDIVLTSTNFNNCQLTVNSCTWICCVFIEREEFIIVIIMCSF
jgi:hypothetical protein